jgi:hypothetical protein
MKRKKRGEVMTGVMIANVPKPQRKPGPLKNASEIGPASHVVMM